MWVELPSKEDWTSDSVEGLSWNWGSFEFEIISLEETPPAKLVANELIIHE